MQKFHRTFAPIDPLSCEEVEEIHAKTLRLLSDTGISMRCADARESFRAVGATVNGEKVRFGPDLLQAALATVPREFQLVGRNGVNEVKVGGNECVCAPTYGATHVIGADGQRRSGTLADVQRLHRAFQAADEIQNAGSNVVEPSDVPPEFRHLHVLESLMTHTDKPFMAVSTSRDPAVSQLGIAQLRVQDSVDIARIALGSTFASAPCMVGVATCNTALTWEASALGVIRTLAAAGQAIMVAPFSIAGSNAPEDAESLLVQVNAEVLSGMVYAQLVRAGTPVLYGPYVTTRDPASGNSMAGTPEICLYLLAFGQLARYYCTPYRGGGLITGAKTCGYQAGVEGSAGLFASMLAGSHFLFHAGGWLENGLTFDSAKLLLDLEELRKMMRLQRGLNLQRTAPLFLPVFSDYASFESWRKSGEPASDAIAASLARARWQFDVKPATSLPAARVAEIREYVLKREHAQRRS